MSQAIAAEADDLYASLNVETRIIVQQRTSEIRTLMRRTAQDIVEIGLKLIEVKARLGHGNFYTWLRAEFGWSESAAVKFMQVAERFKSVNFTDLNIAPSALYLLAAPSAPDSALDEALLRAEEGEQITHRMAQEILVEHRPMWTPTMRDPATGLLGPGIEESKSSAGRVATDTVQGQPLAKPAWVIPEMTQAVEATTESVGGAHKMAVHFSSRTPEHCTPENIILPTLACLGEIDLDPCSEGGVMMSNQFFIATLPGAQACLSHKRRQIHRVAANQLLKTYWLPAPLCSTGLVSVLKSKATTSSCMAGFRLNVRERSP
jgi:hypothetical protein